MIDSLTGWLQAGFRARERTGIRSCVLDTDGRTSQASNPPEAVIDRSQFAVDLGRICTETEHRCLWARYVLEGQPEEERKRITDIKIAEFVDRHWRGPRMTSAAVGRMIKSAERKLLEAQPWRVRVKTVSDYDEQIRALVGRINAVRARRPRTQGRRDERDAKLHELRMRLRIQQGKREELEAKP